jgi:HAD superfamily hydrolase (TIGR01509 family)
VTHPLKLPFIPQALLLDLDGTLVDSEPWHKKAEVITFARFGLEIDPHELLGFTGMTLDRMLAGVREKWGLHVLVEDFLEVQKPVFRGIIEAEIDLFSDAERLLSRFGNMRKAMVTSSLPWYLEAVSSKHPILIDAFELRVCAADVESGKPHPEPFLLAAERLRVCPDGCVAVEDSANGVKSAKAAGCFVVGIDREADGHLGHADAVVRSMDEIVS